MKNRFAFPFPALVLFFLIAPPAFAQQIVTFQPSPPAPSPTMAPAWYYCADPAGYFPMVPQCRASWQRLPVATTPVPASVPVPPSVPAPNTQQQIAPLPVSQLMAPAPPIAPRQVVFTNMPSGSLREQDDRKLNSLAFEFLQIDPAASDAATRLKELETRVEAYRQTLETRADDEHDIIADTQNLQHRMTEEDARFVVPASPNAAPMPAEAAPAATGNPLSIMPPPADADEAPPPLAAPVPPVSGAPPAAVPAGPPVSL